ncbi:S8 family serine peptidase [Homoserinibacter sp. YIM 151385]|nr:S8 family serine peptidase [Homoserinibacter sp. YIM 151385]WBU39426.1 S8 family serine peptidase [Homoserinibacter sp. YIM 151385]
MLAATLLPAASASADQVRDREYWLGEYGIREAWQTTRGAGVRIAIIDTGVAGSHPDLRGAVVDGADFSGLGASDGQRPVGSEGAEHGTMVGSLAAGRGQPGDAGIIGSAPEAELLAISIGFGEGDADSDTQIAEAVRWAVDHDADVINMSLTRNTRDWPVSWDEAFLYAAEHDVVVVAAAGNRGSGTVEVGAPATMPGVLTVGGVDESGAASFDASSQGITIGVSAPSENLVGALPDGGYALWDGTSGATPIVAGIVALVRAAHPDLDAANVIQRVISTARDAGPAGPDFTYGHGLVDAGAAVRDEVPAVRANPMGDLAEWVRLYRRAETTTGEDVPSGILPVAPEQPGPPWSPLGVLLPTVQDLRLAGPPALVLLGLVGVLAAGAALARRWYLAGRRAR